MKRIAIAAAAALLMLGTAQAQQRAPLYGELGYSFLNLRSGDLDVNPQAIRGIIGYDFHPYFAAEAMLMFGTGSDSQNFIISGVPVNVDAKLRNSFGVFVKPKYDFGNIEAFGRLGWARSKVRFSASAPGASASDSGSESDFAYGLGVNYRFNPRMSVGLDWMKYLDKGGDRLQGWTVNFGYRF